MKKFLEYIQEDNTHLALTGKGLIDIKDSAVRDNINALLNAATKDEFITPYVALERVRKVLANFAVFLPGTPFLENNNGHQVFPAAQFGEKMGIDDQGVVKVSTDSDYSVYFEYQMSDEGGFIVFCEIVTEEELEDILDDASEDEDEAEDDYDSFEHELDEAKFFPSKPGKGKPLQPSKRELSKDEEEELRKVDHEAGRLKNLAILNAILRSKGRRAR